MKTRSRCGWVQLLYTLSMGSGLPGTPEVVAKCRWSYEPLHRDFMGALPTASSPFNLVSPSSDLWVGCSTPAPLSLSHKQLEGSANVLRMVLDFTIQASVYWRSESQKNIVALQQKDGASLGRGLARGHGS